jgi:hypothetical protein
MRAAAAGDSAWSARILSPGFKLERRVLRRARVKIERADAAAEPPGEKHD